MFGMPLAILYTCPQPRHVMLPSSTCICHQHKSPSPSDGCSKAHLHQDVVQRFELLVRPHLRHLIG